MSGAHATQAILVLGIGNLLWADEGFGVRCAQALARRYTFPPQLTILDGGTQGLYLLPWVQAAHKLLIFDAVDYGLAPGTLHCVRGVEVPRFLGARKLSLHQTGFQEVLALSELTGRCPEELVLIGCQPEVLDDFGGSLRPRLRAALELAIERALEQLGAWGVAPCGAGRAHAAQDCLEIERYEAERPSDALACRRGDARFLQPSAAGAQRALPPDSREEA